MARGALETILLYGGGFIILYYILRSWGVIQPMSLKNQQLTQAQWNPLSTEELYHLSLESLPPKNAGDIYYEDRFDVRTGRGKDRRFNFVAEP